MCRLRDASFDLDQVCNGRLAGAGQAGEPEHAGTLCLQRRPGVLCYRQHLLPDVHSATQRKIDRARGNGFVAIAVDENETSGLANFGETIERHRRCRGDVAHADLVERESVCGLVMKRFDVQTEFYRRHACRHRANAYFEDVFPPRQQRLLAHPDQMRFELIGNLRPMLRSDQRVAARHVKVTIKSQSD